MKYMVVFVIVCLLFISCQPQQDQEIEKELVQQTIRTFFDGVTNYNYPQIRSQCTANFLILDMGQKMKLNEFIEFVKSFEGRGNINYDLLYYSMTVKGNVAWTSLTNTAEATIDDQPVKWKWLESAVLEKEDENWKIALYHSTEVKENMQE